MALDFSNLAVEAAEPVETKKSNPAVPLLHSSWNDQEAKKVTVPTEDARSLYGMLVRGAEEIGKGVSVRIKVGKELHTGSKEFWENLAKAAARYADENGGAELLVQVIFHTKARQLRPRKVTTITTGE